MNLLPKRDDSLNGVIGEVEKHFGKDESSASAMIAEARRRGTLTQAQTQNGYERDLDAYVADELRGMLRVAKSLSV